VCESVSEYFFLGIETPSAVLIIPPVLRTDKGNNSLPIKLSHMRITYAQPRTTPASCLGSPH